MRCHPVIRSPRFWITDRVVKWATNVNNKDDGVCIRAEIRTSCRVDLEYYQRGLYGLHVFHVTVVPTFIQGVPGGI